MKVYLGVIYGYTENLCVLASLYLCAQPYVPHNLSVFWECLKWTWTLTLTVQLDGLHKELFSPSLLVLTIPLHPSTMVTESVPHTLPKHGYKESEYKSLSILQTESSPCWLLVLLCSLGAPTVPCFSSFHLTLYLIFFFPPATHGPGWPTTFYVTEVGL